MNSITKKFDKEGALEKLVSMYHDKVSFVDMAKHFKVSVRTIQSQLEEAVIEYKQARFIKNKNKYKPQHMERHKCCGMRINSEYHKEFPCK